MEPDEITRLYISTTGRECYPAALAENTPLDESSLQEIKNRADARCIRTEWTELSADDNSPHDLMRFGAYVVVPMLEGRDRKPFFHIEVDPWRCPDELYESLASGIENQLGRSGLTILVLN